VADGFGDSVNSMIFTSAQFNGDLYAGTWSNDTATHGSEIWKSETGDSETWSKVVSDGFAIPKMSTWRQWRPWPLHLCSDGQQCHRG